MSLAGRVALLAALVLAIAACGGDDDAATTSPDAPSSDASETSNAPVTTTSGAAATTAPVSNGDRIADDGETVSVHYTGTLDDGSEFDSTADREPFQFRLGAGQVIDGFDAAVRGMAIGDVTTVHLDAEDAYGLPDPEAIVELPIDQVPEELREEGLQVTLGSGFPATVVQVTEDTVTIDANHPLAGEALTFEIELIEIHS